MHDTITFDDDSDLAHLVDLIDVLPPQPRREGWGEQGSGSPERTWHAMDVTCPKWHAAPNAPCTPHGTHGERVQWAKEFTRRVWG
ncbi:hypothetical protein OG978_03870 [Streptomyces sp. NBC_01591]|uniref:hypothetical protein n=1 Tax=Streptomyces sp. NBC_01591 TaxID=2975888 RepID=UPI002DD8BD92|nr:hypothetical protein [Streptomyces sp. NBC_01591]WSD66590.1 hypothetical protein OG978_03870 [Streptomyces sp. NBC_01591]